MSVRWCVLQHFATCDYCLAYTGPCFRLGCGFASLSGQRPASCGRPPSKAEGARGGALEGGGESCSSRGGGPHVAVWQYRRQVHLIATPTLPWPRYIARFSRRMTMIAHGLCTSTLRLEFDIASLFAMLALGACMSSGHSCYGIVFACHAYRDPQGSNASTDAE